MQGMQGMQVSNIEEPIAGACYMEISTATLPPYHRLPAYHCSYCLLQSAAAYASPLPQVPRPTPAFFFYALPALCLPSHLSPLVSSVHGGRRRKLVWSIASTHRSRNKRDNMFARVCVHVT